MFGSSNRRTIIAKGLRIVGSVTAEGLVEVIGQVEMANYIALRLSFHVVRRSRASSTRNLWWLMEVLMVRFKATTCF
jgi:hypothetical protein